MSKFKVGDEVVFVKYDQERDDEKEKGFNVGHVYKISRISNLHVRIENEEGFIYVDNFQIKPSGGYQTSNRNKLREHIKSLGFTAIDLSVVAGFSKYYFGSETSESRFNKRGDISDKRFNELKGLALGAAGKLTVKKHAHDFAVKTFIALDEILERDKNQDIYKQVDESRIEMQKSKWIVSKKVFFTFVFFVLLLILFIATGVVKQVF